MKSFITSGLDQKVCDQIPHSRRCVLKLDILPPHISGGFRGGSRASIETPSGTKLLQFHGEI